jgi:tetratricopeptide (TPR) repeat protein
MLALLSFAAPVHAQSAADHQNAAPPMPEDPPRDFDAEREMTSDFWEDALRPHAHEYDEKVASAEVHLAAIGQDPKGFETAERLLTEAIALEPDTETAHWLLAELYERVERWSDCAAERQLIFDRSPSFVPSDRGARSWALEAELAECQAAAGNYEDAVDHYRRILASGDSAESYAHVELAMVYMALGRINDAIDAFDEAMADPQTNPGRLRRATFMYFGAAVAYDRDEQIARSKDMLDKALRIDRTQSAFAAPDNRFLLPADEWYFRGLAEASVPSRRAFAIAYFRRYLTEAGEDGWTERATSHLKDLIADPLTADDIAIRGTGVTDNKKAAGAIARSAGELEDCMKSTPELLFKVTITKISDVQPKAPAKVLGPRAISGPRGGVQVRQELAFDTPSAAVLEAQGCVEAAVKPIKLPKVAGNPGSYATFEWHLIAR